jgi:Predicted exonuclease of the beta-lactamase fold involved in RNA processing
MELTFLGAAGTVTGSRFLLSAPTGRILIDCGMFQGPRAIRRRNWEPFPVPASNIDAVVITHAHLDHCGYLPALVKQGFTGPIYCSHNSARLIPIILRDSAKLQEEDTAYARRSGYSRSSPRSWTSRPSACTPIATNYSTGSAHPGRDPPPPTSSMVSRRRPPSSPR